MNSLRYILKANIINTLGLNKLRNKKTGKISIPLVALVVVSILFFFGFSFFYFIMFGDLFANQGMPQLILIIGLLGCLLLSLLMTIISANGYLFKSKDYEMLMSLPVKPRTVFLSKLFYLLLMNYGIMLFIYLPTIIVYAIYNPTGFVFWIMVLPVFLLLPLFMVSIGGFISSLIGIFTARLRFKNLITIAVALVFTIMIIVLNFQTSMIEEDPSGFTETVLRVISFLNIGPTIYEALTGKWLSLLIFTGFSTIPFALFVYLAGAYFQKMNLKNRGTYVRKNFKAKTLKKTTQNRALIFREIKRYFSSPIYVLNTIIGPVLTTVVLVLAVMNVGGALDFAQAEAEDMSFIPFILTSVLTFMLGVNSTTSCSISLEGQSFWILKSSPLHERQIFHAKIMVNILVTIPFIIINVIIAAFVFPLTPIDFIFMLLVPTLVSIYISYIGLFVNILFPRFDYENETKAIKQSISVFITMLSGFLGTLLILGPGLYLGFTLENTLLGYLIKGGMGLVIASTAMLLLYTVGARKFKKLVC